MLLTFVRTVELRGARWAEFDLERAEWGIPAPRMKMRKDHLVPLSQQALELLRELQGITGKGEYLFPNHRRPKSFMGAATLNKSLKSMGFNGFSAHSFRATASTFLNEMGYRSDLVEKQLAHQPQDKIRASYNRAEYMEERRAMMQSYADFIDALSGGNVISLKERRVRLVIGVGCKGIAR
ncbi:MAG: tyrosine-type recombinase/integrase [Gammaproteobacteria bacterium]